MLCAMLVHQATTFPQPLNQLSRWLERHRDPIDEAVAAFDAQPWRRIIKTHTPLDGVPYDPEVSYVFCDAIRATSSSRCATTWPTDPKRPKPTCGGAPGCR